VTPSLLSPEFSRELEALRKLLRLRARSGGSGTATARRRGRGSEFEEHRPYAHGDDVGRLDWLAFARTGQPVSKEHRADEDTVLRLLVDASASLDFGTPTKLEVATRVAAAMAFLSLSEGHRTELAVAAPRGVAGHPAHRGRAALGVALRELSAIVAEGRTDLAGALASVVARAERPGALLVLSDFLDEGPVTEALARAHHAGHELTLVQILTPEELHPELQGDVALVDSETGEAVELSADPTTLGAYERRLSALFETLGGVARKTGASYVRASTEKSLLGVVRRILARGRD
jgi:uncharacterized protein (DUF58 family)